VTGHRQNHPDLDRFGERIAAAVREALDAIGAAVAAETPPFGPGSIGPTRLHRMLADGADQLFAREALARGWELVAPLPMGKALNCAVNAAPGSSSDAQALMDGGAPADPVVAARAQAIFALYGATRLFELAEVDDAMAAGFLQTLDAPNDRDAHDAFAADLSVRVAMAAQLVIEQSDNIIAVWDGRRTSRVGGTGHTVARALTLGAPVIWIDPAAPEDWRVLRAPEALANLAGAVEKDRTEQVATLVRAALRPSEASASHGGGVARPGVAALDARHWHAHSDPVWHIYRRVEALFGGEKGEAPWRQPAPDIPDARGGRDGRRRRARRSTIARRRSGVCGGDRRARGGAFRLGGRHFGPSVGCVSRRHDDQFPPVVARDRRRTSRSAVRRVDVEMGVRSVRTGAAGPDPGDHLSRQGAALARALVRDAARGRVSPACATLACFGRGARRVDGHEGRGPRGRNGTRAMRCARSACRASW
jgi:hypothetical protein